MSRGAVGGGHKVGLARVARKAGPWWGGLGEASLPPLPGSLVLFRQQESQLAGIQAPMGGTCKNGSLLLP